MSISKQTRQLLLLLALALSIVLLLDQGSQVSQNNSDAAAQQEKPSAFASNAIVHSYEGTGRPRISIKSLDSLYYKTSNRVQLNKPEIFFRADNDRHYWLRADEGRYQLGEELFILSGDVQLSALPEAVSPELLYDQEIEGASVRFIPDLTLSTEELLFDASKRFISTQRMVTIKQGSHSLVAEGMEVALDKRNLKLLSKVKGRYVIEKDNG